MVVKKVGQSEAVTKRATCKQCGAILEYVPSDVKSQSLYSMAEYDGERFWIECPQCKSDVVVAGN